MKFIKRLARRILKQKFPTLKKKLIIAKIEQDPVDFLASKLQMAVMVAATMMILTFFLVSKMGMSMALVPLSFIFWFAVVFFTLVKSADSAISKRRKQIDKDVLFAGRFLLVKLSSGKSLVNSIEDASKSYGVASSYFQEIMKDIDLGTSVEDALEKATRTCPSDKLRKILFQITNALKIGIDVSQMVESVLDEIAHEQLMEIEAYGKKLSSVALFYMLFAVVLPSLGLALLLVIASLVSLELGSSAFIIMGFFLILEELMFITVFKHIRPDVNL